jgi:hypothetical protein
MTPVVAIRGGARPAPTTIALLVAAQREQPGAIVVGTSERAGGRWKGVAAFFASWATGVRLLDVTPGVVLYPAELFAALDVPVGRRQVETDILLRAASRGWPIVHVPVTVSDRAPDGRLASATRAAHLARWVGRRWRKEAGAALGTLARCASAERMHARHTAVLSQAASCAGEPGRWALAVGAAVVRRFASTAAGWWRAPRARNARAAGIATAALPLVGLAIAADRIGDSRVRAAIDAFMNTVYSVDILGLAEP